MRVHISLPYPNDCNGLSYNKMVGLPDNKSLPSFYFLPRLYVHIIVVKGTGRRLSSAFVCLY